MKIEKYDLINKIINESSFFNAVEKFDEFDERELLRALRDATISEHEAIKQYETLIDSTSNEKVKKVLQDIANEEKVHVGELLALIKEIDPEEVKFYKEGEDEVEELK